VMTMEAQGPTAAQFRQLRRDVCRRALDSMIDEIVRLPDYVEDEDERRRAKARRRRRAKVQYHQHEETADGQRCPTGSATRR